MKDLHNKTLGDLREIAKQLSIKGRWDMNKEQLVKAIQEHHELTSDKSGVSNKVKPNIAPENVSEGFGKIKRTTMDYLSNVEPGTVVAFKRPDTGAYVSGMLTEIATSYVVIETKHGTAFKVPPEAVVWVKTGKFWPKWVFGLFNGETDDEVMEVEGYALS